MGFFGKDQNTQIKKELASLKEELEDFRFYFEELSTSLPLPFLIVSPLGVILDANKGFEELSGIKKVDVLGQDIADFFDNKGKMLLLQRKVLNGESIKGEEMVITSSKGKIPVSMYMERRRDRGENIIGYFVSIFNISNFKGLQRNLEAEVESRTKELTDKVKELERFYKLTIGRELKMVQLKEKIKILEQKFLKNGANSQKTNVQ